MNNPSTLTRLAAFSFFITVAVVPSIAMAIPFLWPTLAAFLARHTPFLPSLYGLSATLIAILIHAPIANMFYRKAASVIHAKNYNICPNCEYDLSTIHNPDLCPERGNTTTHTHRITFWNHKLPKHLQNAPPRPPPRHIVIRRRNPDLAGAFRPCVTHAGGCHAPIRRTRVRPAAPRPRRPRPASL
jgi:hypothetical protein